MSMLPDVAQTREDVDVTQIELPKCLLISRQNWSVVKPFVNLVPVLITVFVSHLT